MEELELLRLKGVLTREHLDIYFDPNNSEYFYRNGMPSNTPIVNYSGPDCLRAIYSTIQGAYTPVNIRNPSIDFIFQFLKLSNHLPSSISSIIELLRSFNITFNNMWNHFRPSICIIVKDLVLKYSSVYSILDLIHVFYNSKKAIQTGSQPIDKLFPCALQESLDNLDHFTWDNPTLKLNENDANTILCNKDSSYVILPFLYPHFAKCHGKSLANVNSRSKSSLTTSIAPTSYTLKQIQSIDEVVSESTVVLQLPNNMSPYKYFWVTFHYNMGVCISNRTKDLPNLLSNNVLNDLTVLFTQNKVKFGADQLAIYCARIFATLMLFSTTDGNMASIHEYLTNGHDILKAMVLMGLAAHSKSSKYDKKAFSNAHLISFITADDSSYILRAAKYISKGLLLMNAPRRVPYSKQSSKPNSTDYLQECCNVLLTFNSNSTVGDLQDVDFTCHNGLTSDMDMMVVGCGVGFGLTVMNLENNRILNRLINNLIKGISTDRLPFANKTGMYIALMLHYLNTNQLPTSVNIFNKIDTPDAFLVYKTKYSVEETLYRALLISISSNLSMADCLKASTFPFIHIGRDYTSDLGNSDLQSHYYAIITGTFLGKCILNIGTSDPGLLAEFNKICKCFKAISAIHNAQTHFYSNTCIMGICCVFSGSCSDSITSFIKKRILISVEYSHHAALQQSLGLLFLGNGTCCIRNSLVGQAFTLLLVFPDQPLDLEDSTLLFPALRYLWLQAIDDRKYETINMLDGKKLNVCAEVKSSFTENKKLQMTPVLIQNTNGSQVITIQDNDYEPLNVELYMNEHSGIKTDDKQVKKGSIHLLPKIVHPLHQVTQIHVEHI
eukprot:NODE_23_length_38171_cov_0.318108.p4 type:complete len:837 gc:universal NODE_23_length_38171_cov_0.318108:8354-10864(+)